MNPYWQLDGSRLYQGHVLDVLAALAARSVHMVATSPPYWGLRDYSLPPLEWGPVRYAPMAGLPEIEIPGCDPECRHEWGEERIITNSAPRDHNGAYDWSDTRGREQQRAGTELNASQGSWCRLCSGWRGSLGLEPTVEMYVGHIVAIWRELKRVLRDDGTCWLNLGDSYAGSNAAQGGGGISSGLRRDGRPEYSRVMSNTREIERRRAESVLTKSPSALKPKDLCGIPWRVTFALQADGWWLRRDNIWAKGRDFDVGENGYGSSMPESCEDRPVTAHEYVFLLAKSDCYYYDAVAVRQKWDGGEHHLRSVWIVNTSNYKGSHFATFPAALVSPMIRAGTSERGACPQCGAPWRRVTEKTGTIDPSAKGSRFDIGKTGVNGAGRTQEGERYLSQTTGWRPTCQCDAGDPVPCTVLDIFLGSGTTADVARQLGRRWVGIELNQTYCDDHIIPRLEEPLIEWAQSQEEQEPDPEAVQMRLV